MYKEDLENGAISSSEGTEFQKPVNDLGFNPNDVLNELDEVEDNGESSIDVNESVRSEPPFSPSLEIMEGLNVGRLEEVHYKEYEYPMLGKDQKPSKNEYRGKVVASLMLIVRSLPKEGKPQQAYKHIINLPVFVKNDGTKLDPKKTMDNVENAVKVLLEIYQAYRRDMPSNKALPAKLSAAIPTIGDNTETRIKKWNILMKTFKLFFETGTFEGTPVYKKGSEFVPCWFILEPAYPNFTHFAFPTFVRSGFWEVIKKDGENILAANIKINPTVPLELQKKELSSKQAAGNAGASANVASKTVITEAQKSVSDMLSGLS